MRLFLLSLVVALPMLASGCFDSTCDKDDPSTPDVDEERDCLSNALTRKGLGGSCKRLGDCKVGLQCVEGSCQATGDTKTGGMCRLTAECGSKNYCGSSRTCKVAGIAEENARCFDTSNCKRGLVCEPPDISALGTVTLNELASVSALCEKTGDKEQGQSCTKFADCLAGLYCVDEQQVCDATKACGDRKIKAGAKICATLPMGEFDTEIPALPKLWDGVVCPEVGKDDYKEAYFKVPRGNEKESEFYSLPFPNDIRRSGGKVDMASHPVPPEDLGIPLVNRYVEAAGTDLDGFSTNPVVYFRFSHYYDWGTVNADTIKIIDITDKSLPEYNKVTGLEWKTVDDDLSNYICPEWLAFKPPHGSPLKAGRTYAAIVTTGVKARGAKKNDPTTPFKRSEDLIALLDDSAPSDGDLKAAHAAYKPLRDWIADTNQNASTILNAAVFTTLEPEAIVPALRTAIHADSLPSLSELTVCESANTKSPCESQEIEKDDDGKETMVTRGACPAPSADYTVVHGKIRLPVFQKGTQPYLAPDEGGEIELDSGGKPMVQGHQNVCFAMSVPKDAAPAAGYPVLVYGHGTGGSFNGEMDSGGFAGPLARAAVPSVLIAIDLPQHGTRRGESKDDPEGLFYNFLNPRAARDNVLQGSADMMAVIRFIKEGDGLAAGSPLPAAVELDPTRIALMGHSQGATHASLVISYEPDIIGAVLSGNGGNLASSLLTKTSPVDIAAVVPLGLMDPDKSFKLAGGEFNPALSVIQWMFDASDPVNYAPHLIRSPTTQVPSGHHVFMTYGLTDTYSTESTQQAYIRAAGRGMPAVTPMLRPLQGDGDPNPWPTEAPPVSGNAMIGGEPRTIAVRQYTPKDGSDGHFVGIRNGQDGRPDVERFLTQLLSGQTPAIGQ